MEYIKLNILIAGLLLLAFGSTSQTISFNACPDDDLTLCEPDDRLQLPDNNKMILGETNPEASSCSAHLRLQENITNSCGIIVTFIVDYYPFNGSQRVRIQDTSEAFTNANDVASLTLDTKLYGTPAVLLDGIPYNEDCPDDPGGFHRLVWTAINECGDVDSCSYLVRIEDCIGPLAEAVPASILVFPIEQQVTISAQDYIKYAIDDCSPVNWLLFSWSESIFKPTKVVNCDSIAENGGPAFEFDIWAADAGVDTDCSGNITWNERSKTHLTVLILFDDDCAGEIYDGKILSENLVPVPDVLVSLHGGPMVLTTETDQDGEYRLPEIEDTTINYTIIPTKTTGVPDGISTLDLIKIQKHLLGIEQLSSPYKMIAADANNNSDISATDLLELRKVILRITSNLPNNTSWRFVPATHVFADSTNPWPFPSSSNLDNLDFVGIKVGDVNETITEPSHSGIAQAVRLYADDKKAEAGDMMHVDIRASSYALINGLQATIELGDLKVVDIIPGRIDIDINSSAIFKHRATVSWSEARPELIHPGDVLLTLVLRASSNGWISDQLDISSSLTEAEIYIDEDDQIVPHPMVLSYRASDRFSLALNGSNIVRGHTIASVRSPEDGMATLWIFDTTGRSLLKRDVEVQNGRATFNLSHSCGNLDRGLYLLTATQGANLATIKFYNFVE